jgi:hypothetical protein
LASVRQLEQDFRANRNEALQAMNSSLHAANLPAAVDIDQRQLDEFCQQQFEAALQRVNTDHVAEKAAGGSAAAFALSNVVTIVVERAIIYTVGDAAATAGGAVATGTAGGAAAGSWVPGLGTAIGATTGLLAGAAVDMWISSRDKERTTNQVTASLTQIEGGIIRGDGKQPGVESILNDAASGQAKQLGQKIQDQLKEAAK